MSDFEAQMHQIRFCDPAGATYSAPKPIAVFKGPRPISRGRGKEGKGRETGRSEGGKVMWPPIHISAWLRH